MQFRFFCTAQARICRSTCFERFQSEDTRAKHHIGDKQIDRNMLKTMRTVLISLLLVGCFVLLDKPRMTFETLGTQAATGAGMLCRGMHCSSLQPYACLHAGPSDSLNTFRVSCCISVTVDRLHSCCFAQLSIELSVTSLVRLDMRHPFLLSAVGRAAPAMVITLLYHLNDWGQVAWWQTVLCLLAIVRIMYSEMFWAVVKVSSCFVLACSMQVSLTSNSVYKDQRVPLAC